MNLGNSRGGPRTMQANPGELPIGVDSNRLLQVVGVVVSYLPGGTSLVLYHPNDRRRVMITGGPTLTYSVLLGRKLRFQEPIEAHGRLEARLRNSFVNHWERYPRTYWFDRDVDPRLHLMMRGERDAVPLNDARTPRPTRGADEGRYRVDSHLDSAQRTALEKLRSELEQ